MPSDRIGTVIDSLPGQSLQARRLALVDDAFRSLPDCYVGAEPGFDATFHIVLGDVGHTWEVRATAHGVRVRRGVTSRRPDVTIGTDAATWLALREGRLSGIDAFAQRRLCARGDLDRAVGFEGLFRRPDGREPRLRVADVPVGRMRISTLTMGAGPDVLLLHGLGGTKASLFETAAALSRSYRVHVPDLPGFGSSSKPPMAPYNAGWYAETVLELLDTLEIDRAHFVGNSLGGRIAIEVALREPGRARALGLLCPAVAFIKRTFHPFVRLARPELALVPHRFRRAAVSDRFWLMFAERDLVDPSLADMAVDEFQRVYASAGARRAFMTTARNIYLEAPYGKRGFYTRLATLTTPALFIWGSHDRIVPAAFKPYVAEVLPHVEQIVLDGCGHVPQIERPQQTNALLTRFFAHADALGADGELQRDAA
jgi:pimeloyl-ACP methyl ester carboxylesterase